jgi:hypothetical protein
LLKALEHKNFQPSREVSGRSNRLNYAPVIFSSESSVRSFE